MSSGTPPVEGHPDNLEFDADGRLWIAMPISSEIAVLDLASGEAIEARIRDGVSWLELFGPSLWEPAPGPMAGMILSPGDGAVYVTVLGNATIRLPR